MRRWMIALIAAVAAVVFTLLIVPRPLGEASTPKSSTVIDYQQVASRHVIATEQSLAAGRFPCWSRDTTWSTSGSAGWTSGFFPGELWLEYRRTGNPWFMSRALARERPLAGRHVDAGEQDIGMRYFYSIAKAYDVTRADVDRRVALNAAACLAARFVPAVGALRSRPGTTTCPVIIDELMNAQLLFWGADHGGPASWREMAHSHALTVVRDFMRADGSTLHVVEYDSATGRVKLKTTAQGYSAESTWARGQAWAIYGLAAAYRETHDAELLAGARRAADWYIAHLPEDHVPYWDFDAPDIPGAPRDSSAAAIAASGLLDLAGTVPDASSGARYDRAARASLASLSSPAYLSRGENPAVLLHGTLNRRSPETVDVGLSFGDYFFLEAEQRMAPEAAGLAPGTRNN